MRYQDFSVSLFMRQQKTPIPLLSVSMEGSALWRFGWLLRQPLTLPEREEMDKTHLKFLPLKLSVWLCSELVGAVVGHSELNIYVKRRFYLTKSVYHKSSLFQSSCSGQGTLWLNFLSFGRMLNPCPPNSQGSVKDKDFLLCLNSRLDL